MIKVKKIIAVGLTALTFVAASVSVNLLTTSEVAYAYGQNYRGALLEVTVSKTATNGGWYTEDNFEQTTTRTFRGNTYTYHLTCVTYSKTGGYWTTTAHYAID